jgi:hypothetical protein
MSRALSLMNRCLTAALFAAAIMPSASTAANISHDTDEYGNHYLVLDGEIVPGDAERFAAEIFAANARGYRLDALRLNSPGGSVWEAMAMAVMVRWVENMATVVQKDSKCESACFGLFAAGWRKYVDPFSDPTQISVHSLYQLIGQEGMPNLFLKERGDVTIEAVRLLKALGIPNSIIGKIVTTPPDQVSYLMIDDLGKMGVTVTGHPEAVVKDWTALGEIGEWLQRQKELTFFTPAILRANVTLNTGVNIPAGTVVIVSDDVARADFQAKEARPWTLPLCFSPTFQFATAHLCKVSYQIAGRAPAVAQLRDASLNPIRQGWQNWFSAPLPAQEPPPTRTPKR